MSQSRALCVLASILVAACDAADEQAPAWRGPLLRYVEQPAQSLADCAVSHRTYATPFWRAPYRECHQELARGSQLIEIDADSVITMTSRVWILVGAEGLARYRAELDRLTRDFGAPARRVEPLASPPAPTSKSDRPPSTTLLIGYCTAWQEPDSLEASLHLMPRDDVFPVPNPARVEWRLSRYLRRGPLPDAVSCGL
jgi:hypothetical protein